MTEGARTSPPITRALPGNNAPSLGRGTPVPRSSDDANVASVDSSQASAAAEESETAAAPEASARGSIWTIPLLCIGIATIAVCMLLPLVEENRRLVYERERLRLDLAAVQNQVSVNQEFLRRVADDPTLAERLAQRQMRYIREGASVLDLHADGNKEPMSPFLLLSVPKPPALAPYEPVAGTVASACRNPQTQLYITGAGLFLVATGLVLGAASRTPGET